MRAPLAIPVLVAGLAAPPLATSARAAMSADALAKLAQNDDRTNGVGDVQLSAFRSPADPGHWSWGAGAIMRHRPGGYP